MGDDGNEGIQGMTLTLRAVGALFVVMAGGLASGFGIAITVHTHFVLPSLMAEVGEDRREDIEAHRLSGVHPGALMRDEYAQDRAELFVALDKLATKEAVSALSDKLDVALK